MAIMVISEVTKMDNFDSPAILITMVAISLGRNASILKSLPQRFLRITKTCEICCLVPAQMLEMIQQDYLLTIFFLPSFFQIV